MTSCRLSIARLGRVFLFLVLAFTSASANGQEASLRFEGLEFVTPSGWSSSSGRGVLSFHPPVRSDVVFEVRSVEIQTEQAPMFSDSFHTSLRHAGLELVSRGAQVTIPNVGGFRSEYRTLSDSGLYRLVVIEFVEGENYWVISGFFDEGRRESYSKVLERFLASISASQE